MEFDSSYCNSKYTKELQRFHEAIFSGLEKNEQTSCSKYIDIVNSTKRGNVTLLHPPKIKMFGFQDIFLILKVKVAHFLKFCEASMPSYKFLILIFLTGPATWDDVKNLRGCPYITHGS